MNKTVLGLKQNEVIHCHTSEEALLLIKIAGQNGLKWRSTIAYRADNTNWESYGKDTCYDLNNGSYSGFDYFKRNDYIITPFSTFVNNMKNIQTITREGLQEIYDVACDNWKERIQEFGKRDIFKNEIGLTQTEVETMFKAALPTQKIILDKYFKREKPRFSSQDLKIGEMMIIKGDQTAYEGHTILRAYSGFVSLTNPSNTWTEGADLEGEKMEKGNRYIITAK